MGPVQRLAEAIEALRRSLQGEDMVVDCGGAAHRIRLVGDQLSVLDHDGLSEAAMRALGGDDPVCLQVRDAWPRLDLLKARHLLAAPSDPRSGPAARHGVEALMHLPNEVLRWRTASLLRERFGGASPAVRTRAAQFGLRVLAPGFVADLDRRNEFSRVVRFPRFDVGDRLWTSEELDVLALAFAMPARRGSPAGTGAARLTRLPVRADQRRVVLRRIADGLVPGRRYSSTEIDERLRRFCDNPRRIRRELVVHGLVSADGDRYQAR